MKKKFFFLALCFSVVLVWSCNNSDSTSTTNTDSSDTNTASANGDTSTHSNSNMSVGNTSNSGNAGNTNNLNNTPLSNADSSFVLEAAAGGMMEVQAGELAQQNAKSQRVKDFGGMMVTDHSKANDELKSYASGRGLTIPDKLPADMQKHVNAMKSMKGAAFDKKYVSMMVEDHQKTVAKFKKESAGANDAQLKTWAGNTLPVLQKHLDSILAIKKGM